MSGCLRKIHWGTILFAAVVSAAVGLVIGYFWMRGLDLDACIAAAAVPDSGNPVSDLVARLVQVLAVGVVCILVRMAVFVPLYVALAAVMCAAIILWRVKDARLLNIILALLFSLALEFTALLIFSMIVRP